MEVAPRQATNEKRREERKKLTVEKRCVNCGKTFETSRGNKIYCSEECERKAQNAANNALMTHKRRRMPPPKISADDVTAAANAEGLSYGQYSVKHGLYANVGA